MAAASDPLRWKPSDLPTLRAAYSDRTAALMAFFADFAYQTAAGAGPAAVPIQLATVGFTDLTYFHNGLIDGWALIAESPLMIVLAFRGTVSWKNWETNIQARQVNPQKTDPKLRVHEGFDRAFQKLAHSGMSEKIDAIKQRTGGRVPIYITGHSLGGALAQIAAAVFGSDQIAACYTFGSPRVGNAYFDPWVKPPSYRIVNTADIVPQIPWWPFVYRHSGDPRFLPKHVTSTPYRFQPNFLMRAGQFVTGVFQFFKAGTILGIEDHHMPGYLDKLDAVAQARTQKRRDPAGPE
jgi:hypothetical protein